jgi:hypothetical protein
VISVETNRGSDNQSIRAVSNFPSNIGGHSLIGSPTQLCQSEPVTSWRDSASPGAQDDLDGLLDTALPFALEMLKQHGEFFPYAFVLEQSGETRMLAGAPRKGEHPASMDISAFLFEGLGEQRAMAFEPSPWCVTFDRRSRTRCASTENIRRAQPSSYPCPTTVSARLCALSRLCRTPVLRALRRPSL